MDWIKSVDKKPTTEPQIIVSRKTVLVDASYWCESARLDRYGRYLSDTDGMECHFDGMNPDAYTHWMPFEAPQD